MSRKYYGESKYNSCKFWSSSFAATVFLLVISGITFIVCGAVIAGPGIRALNFEVRCVCGLIRGESSTVEQFSYRKAGI